MFPHFQPPRCENDYFNFVQQLSDLRRDIYQRPLSFPHLLLVEAQCQQPSSPPGHTAIFDPPGVPRRHQPKRRTRIFDEFSSPNDMKVILKGELQTGREGWSQVYAGSLTIGARSCNVVVKLYQECMFRDPSPADFYSSDRTPEANWPSGTEVAQREAWAYHQLRQYQGSTLPFSYGFYKFTLRSESVVGFIMEQMDGITVEDYLVQNNHAPEARMQLADALAWAAHRLHYAGVVHCDIRRSNMRIFNDNGENSLYVVLFDWSNAAQTVDVTNRPVDGRDAASIMTVAIGRGDDTINHWRDETRKKQPPWLRMFMFNGYLWL